MKSVLIFGDICPRWGNGKQFASKNAESVFHDILPLIHEADFVTCNLEAPATKESKTIPKTSMNLKCYPDDLQLLKDAGFSALSLANNHILDYGVHGLNDTLKTAQELQMITYGAGRIEEASSPLYHSIGGKMVGILSFAEHEFNCAVDYGIGANLWDDLTSIDYIRRTKDKCDYLVIQYHGGIENYEYPSPLLQKKCRLMIDAGANLVTCQHSHCIGTLEEWNNGLIIYGQGNSVFGYNMGDIKWNVGLIIQLKIEKCISIDLIPISAHEDGVHLLDPEASNLLLHRVRLNSKLIKKETWVKKSWVSFCSTQRNSYLPLQYGWNRVLIKLNKMSNGKLLNSFVNGRKKMVSMNLVRCDAHREVINTILEEEFYKYSER